jgi:hypothetical protein
MPHDKVGHLNLVTCLAIPQVVQVKFSPSPSPFLFSSMQLRGVFLCNEYKKRGAEQTPLETDLNLEHVLKAEIGGRKSVSQSPVGDREAKCKLHH